jgi:hypothetical protein
MEDDYKSTGSGPRTITAAGERRLLPISSHPARGLRSLYDGVIVQCNSLK